MAKTYTAAGTVAAGDVATAAAWNVVTADVNNLIVPPMARISMTSAVNVANSSHTDWPGFKSTDSSEDYDTDGMVTLSATASGITVNTAGVYSCTAQSSFAGNTVGIRFARILRVRSGTNLAIASAMVNPPNAFFHTNLAGIIECQVGDLIRLMVFQSSGGSLSMGPDSNGVEYGFPFLAATWIGRTS